MYQMGRRKIHPNWKWNRKVESSEKLESIELESSILKKDGFKAWNNSSEKWIYKRTGVRNIIQVNISDSSRIKLFVKFQHNQTHSTSKI